VACWSTKAAISLKRVKIEEKLLWRPYRTNSPTLFGTVPSPLLYGVIFPRIGGSQPQPQTAIAISGTGKATNFKFGRYIHRVHRTKAHQNFGKRGRRRFQDCQDFLSTPYYLRMG